MTIVAYAVDRHTKQVELKSLYSKCNFIQQLINCTHCIQGHHFSLGTGHMRVDELYKHVRQGLYIVRGMSL